MFKQDGNTILVIIGPSGVGKSSLVAELTNQFPADFELVIGHTTRDPRHGEVPGRDFVFLDRQQFFHNKQLGIYAESVENYGNHYGVTLASINAILQDDKTPVLLLTPPGIDNLKQNSSFNLFVLGVRVTDESQLRLRLKKRGDSHDTIERRMQSASGESAYILAHTDAIVVNDYFKVAYEEFKRILKLPYCTTAVVDALEFRDPDHPQLWSMYQCRACGKGFNCTCWDNKLWCSHCHRIVEYVTPGLDNGLGYAFACCRACKSENDRVIRLQEVLIVKKTVFLQKFDENGKHINDLI